MKSEFLHFSYSLCAFVVFPSWYSHSCKSYQCSHFGLNTEWSFVACRYSFINTGSCHEPSCHLTYWPGFFNMAHYFFYSRITQVSQSFTLVSGHTVSAHWWKAPLLSLLPDHCSLPPLAEHSHHCLNSMKTCNLLSGLFRLFTSSPIVL